MYYLHDMDRLSHVTWAALFCDKTKQRDSEADRTTALNPSTQSLFTDFPCKNEVMFSWYY